MPKLTEVTYVLRPGHSRGRGSVVLEQADRPNEWIVSLPKDGGLVKIGRLSRWVVDGRVQWRAGADRVSFDRATVLRRMVNDYRNNV